MPDNNALLPIGELARRAGTAPSALRYYERIGLLPPGERAGGKRHYPPASAERLGFVRLPTPEPALGVAGVSCWLLIA